MSRLTPPAVAHLAVCEENYGSAYKPVAEWSQHPHPWQLHPVSFVNQQKYKKKKGYLNAVTTSLSQYKYVSL